MGSQLLQQKVCQALRSAQENSGLTQRELGRRMEAATGENWNQARVWKLLRSRGAWSIDHLAAAAEILSVSLRSLLPCSSSERERVEATTRTINDALQQNRFVVLYVYPPGSEHPPITPERVNVILNEQGAHVLTEQAREDLRTGVRP